MGLSLFGPYSPDTIARSVAVWEYLLQVRGWPAIRGQEEDLGLSRTSNL